MGQAVVAKWATWVQEVKGPKPPSDKLWWRQVEALMGTQGYWYEPEEGPAGGSTGLFRNQEGLEVRLTSVNLLERPRGLRIDCYVVGRKVASLPIGEDGTVHQRSLEKVLGACIRAAGELRANELAAKARYKEAQESYQRRLVAERWLASHAGKPGDPSPVGITYLGALEFRVQIQDPGKADLLVEFLAGIGIDLFKKEG